jgi:hypothetical protein
MHLNIEHMGGWVRIAATETQPGIEKSLKQNQYPISHLEPISIHKFIELRVNLFAIVHLIY